MSKTKIGLWALTLATAWWVLGIVSAVVASKGGDNDIKAVPDVDDEEPPRLALVSSKPQGGRSYGVGPDGLDSGAGEVLGDA